jgi:hypothetical protein
MASLGDEPGEALSSPEDNLDGVHERGYALRRRRARIRRAVPLAAVAAVVLLAAAVATGGPEPGGPRRLRSAGAPDGTDTTTADVTTVVAGEGSMGPVSSVTIPGATRPTVQPSTTSVRPTTVPPPTTPPTTTAPAGSGVSGTVLYGPQCPVERADQPCPDEPGPASITLERAGGVIVGQAQAGSDGRFAIAAPAGQYIVRATSQSAMGGCQPTDATVTEGHYTDVTISCDTGIR